VRVYVVVVRIRMMAGGSRYSAVVNELAVVKHRGAGNELLQRT
jgi:hypothetical protein